MYRPMFFPPRDSPLMIRLAGAVLPGIAQLMGNIRNVQVPADDLARLDALRGQRGILSPNHPTGNDPIVMFWVSRIAEMPFNFLAAREVLVGYRGWLMNCVGAYSVVRGVADRESLRTTRRLLAERDRKIVIFPEGEIYEHNDTLLAFQSGVVQIGFWALDDLEKLGKEPRMPILPVAIKYRCCDSPRLAIESSLGDLEQALRLPAARGSLYSRLWRVGDRVLSTLERDAGLSPVDQQEGADLSARIPVVREAMMNRVAHAIGTEVNGNQPPADQLHLLFNALKSWVGMLPDDHTAYDDRLYRRRMEVAAPLFNDLHRLQNFIAITGDYVAAEATAERCLDVLGRLEKEVFGEVRHRVPREALVKIADPIRLEERYDDYRKNKRAVVAELTRTMENTIRGMLQEFSRQSTPIRLDA